MVITSNKNMEVSMEVVDDFAKSLGYTLKEEQRKVLCSFVGGEEVFAALPTGLYFIAIFVLQVLAIYL